MRNRIKYDARSKYIFIFLMKGDGGKEIQISMLGRDGTSKSFVTNTFVPSKEDYYFSRDRKDFEPSSLSHFACSRENRRRFKSSGLWNGRLSSWNSNVS